MTFAMDDLTAIAEPGSDQHRRAVRLACLETSRLFDADWYRERYPDLAEAGLDAAEHFLDVGGSEGRLPHPLFQSDFYLDQNPDVRESGLNPLMHYLERGAAEGRAPNPLFDTLWYVARYLGRASFATNPLIHYIEHPQNDTSPVFQSRWYMAHAMESSAHGENPLAHYLRVGRDAGTLCNDENVLDLDNRSYRLRESGLFDADFYARYYPEVPASGFDPFVHYMLYGHKESRFPHQLFDIEHYGHQVPEHEREGLNPLLHYFERGGAAGLDPNCFFDTAWYRAEYPDCGAEGLNPLAHFIRDGGRSTNPSLRFDAVWYLSRHKDVAAAGVNPLAHYLSTGMDEGRASRAVPPPSGRRDSAADSAALVTLKKAPRHNRRTVLLVTHSGRGEIKGHVGAAVAAYRRADADVVLIVAADRRITAVPQTVMDDCSAVYVRENVGFDFAAWAHVLQHDGSLLTSDVLLLTNDSLLGPTDPAQLAVILDRIDASQADIVGLTENTFYSRHLQSFCLALKRRCLSSYAFNEYLLGIVNLASKNEVITRYELTFSARMRAAGFSQEVLFAAPGADQGTTQAANNRMIFDWGALLDEGLPFVKASLVVGEHRALGEEAVRAALEERGFDLAVLEPTHRYGGPKVWADLAAKTSLDIDRLRVSFFGPLNVANGLGVASRGYVKALSNTGCKLHLQPMIRPFYIHAKTSPDWQVSSFSGAPDVALVHLNGDGWDILITPQQRDLIDRARFKIGLFVWETSFVPAEWLPTIDSLDAIWVPTQFCADIFRAMTSVPVDVVPYVVENEADAAISGDAKMRVCGTFGIDPSRRHILYAFDGSSFLARKNPQALIRAYRAAGLWERGWQLVLKTKHVFDLPEEGRRLLDLVGPGGDVVVIDQPMPRNDLAALFAICQIYASSHSSEGFGLTIAEAMEMGKVVVATDYGGSRDFLDASCGFPVEAREIALDESHGPYLRGAAWGQIDEQALAEALRQAADAVADGSAGEIGAAARTRIRDTLSITAVAAAMSASLGRLVSAQR